METDMSESPTRENAMPERPFLRVSCMIENARPEVITESPCRRVPRWRIPYQSIPARPTIKRFMQDPHALGGCLEDAW